MKFKNIAMAISASTVLLATSAFAQDGQINFTGDITAATCVVATGTQGVQNINLGKVSLQSLSSAGQTSAATEFNIALTGCTANSKAVIKFDGTQVAGNNALLANTGTAGNVGVGIYESDSITPVKLRAATKEITTNQDGDGQFNFIAKYVSTGAATAGSVVASTTFSIVYN